MEPTVPDLGGFRGAKARRSRLLSCWILQICFKDTHACWLLHVSVQGKEFYSVARAYIWDWNSLAAYRGVKNIQPLRGTM